jgi:hypothetical protein
MQYITQINRQLMVAGLTRPFTSSDECATMDYNEDAILTAYIWRHYTDLMTDFERHVGHAMIGRAKADNSSNPKMKALLRQRWGQADDPAINAALHDGADVFRRQVRDRLLESYADQILINRCPVCQRIVRTPNARLCVWCGHTWYEQTLS